MTDAELKADQEAKDKMNAIKMINEEMASVETQHIQLIMQADEINAKIRTLMSKRSELIEQAKQLMKSE